MPALDLPWWVSLGANCGKHINRPVMRAVLSVGCGQHGLMGGHGYWMSGLLSGSRAR